MKSNTLEQKTTKLTEGKKINNTKLHNNNNNNNNNNKWVWILSKMSYSR